MPLVMVKKSKYKEKANDKAQEKKNPIMEMG
jgi:hypothetical protein